MAYTISASLISNTILTSVYLNQIVDDLNVLGIHDHSGSLGEGNSTIQSASSSSGSIVSGSWVYRIEIPINKGKVSLWTGSATRSYETSALLPGGIRNYFFVSLPGNSASTLVYIQSGSFNLDIYYLASPGYGILDVALLGAGAGSAISIASILQIIDCYAATSSLKKATIPIYNSGSYPFRFMIKSSASKNATATASQHAIGPICLIWTGA